MPTCSLCHLDRKFIKAHAIPEAFFRELRSNGEIPLIISGQKGQFPKKAPIGIYDEGILCEFCEPKFGPIDDYAINIFLKNFEADFHPVARGNLVAGFESTTVDPSKVLQFLVSVLWRASVSKHVFYSRIDLGPHEQLASLAVDTQGFNLPCIFDAVLSRWKDKDEDVPINAMLDPHREKWQGINAYRLYFGEIVAYIKVDSRPFPSEFRTISLRSAPPLRIVGRTMAESKDLLALKSTAVSSHQNKLSFARRGHNPSRAA